MQEAPEDMNKCLSRRRGAGGEGWGGEWMAGD